jgi:hypothetical protein
MPVVLQDSLRGLCAGYGRLRAGLVSGRFVKEGAPFEQAVDNSLAREAVGEDPPALPGA